MPDIKKQVTKKPKQSSRNYSQRTLKLLWGRSAGRCAVPECRIEVICDKTEHDPHVLIGEIAHIEASSDSGPRANPSLTSKQKDDYENLILLCSNCHTRFDGQKNSITVEYIQKLKAAHEAWVRESLPERGRSTTGWRVLALQGPHPVDVSSATSALAPDFMNGNPVFFQANSDKEPWLQIQTNLQNAVDSLFLLGDPFDFRLAVFPLAPVSACIALGYFLTSRPRVKLFQYHRTDHIWAWPDLAPPANDIRVEGLPAELNSESMDIAIVFHLSAPITAESLLQLEQPFFQTVHVSIQTPSIHWLQHPEQLKYVAQAAQAVFERCIAFFPNAKCWHLFFAGPAPAGVAIGQQLNPTMSPPVQLYEFRKGQVPEYQSSILLSQA